MGIFVIAGILLAGITGIYIYFYIKRILAYFGLDMSRRSYRIICLFAAVAAAAASVNVWSITALVILHILALSVICDLIFVIFRKLFKNKKQDSRIRKNIRALYRSGLIPIAITGVLLAYGFYNMGHIERKEYQITTEKHLNDYKIALITDTHFGTVQDPEILNKAVEEMNQENLDIVILGGDIVEEGTSKEEMQQVFKLLGGLEASYVEINGELIIAGRGDARWGNVSGRKSVEEILQGADRGHYIITADHQPIQAEENDTQGVDLLLSGHTHAGQIWPVGWMSELTGVLNYGEYQEGDCKVIVSSGFTGWGYPLRTEEHCEYVIINLSQSI